MKKRIISLILVVATLLLTLTGCGFNYAKADLTKYATLSSDFRAALTNESISFKDATFGTTEATRWEKVEDKLAAALLSIAEAEDTKYEGNPAKYDSIVYRYFAVTEDGQVFLTANMDPSKSTSLQLGLTTLEGLNKSISDAFLGHEGEIGKFYNTSAEVLVGKNDVISVTYTDKDGKLHEYVTVTVSDLSFTELLGKKFGDTVETATVKTTTGEGDSATTEVTATYTDVKINSMIKDAVTTSATAANDLIFVTYTATIEYTPAEGVTVDKIVGADGHEYKLDSTGKYTYTVTMAPLLLGEADSGDTKTFKGQLVGKNTGSVTIPSTTDIKETITVTPKPATEGAEVENITETLSVKYSSVKINWIVKDGFGIAEDGSYTGGVSFEYTADKDSTSDKDILGNTVKLEKDKTKLTYYVFPVSRVDVPELDVAVNDDGTYASVSGLDAKDIIRKYHATLLASETIIPDDHEHEADDDHSEFTTYFLACVASDAYKNGDKTLKTLLEELDVLLKASTGTHTKNEAALEKAITALETAQKNLAKDTSEEGSAAKDNLKKAVETARSDYDEAKTESDKTEKEVNDKIDEILACTGGEKAIADAIVEDYTKYQYKLLEDEYKSAVDKEVFADIMELANKYFTCDLNALPKSAVKAAKKSIMNTYKNTFYTGTTSTGSGSTATSKTNYETYNGDFDAFLIAAVKKEMGTTAEITIEKANEYVDTKAREAVRDIMMIYALAEEFDLKLTKEEIKEHKNYYKKTEYQREIYAAYGIMSNYTLDDYLNAMQFDKVMNYFLEEGTDDSANPNAVQYKNIKYKLETEQTESK